MRIAAQKEIPHLNTAVTQFKETGSLVFTQGFAENEYHVALGYTVEKVNQQFIKCFYKKLNKIFGRDQWSSVKKAKILIVRKEFAD